MMCSDWIKSLSRRMPRQQINLEPYRDDIITLYRHGISSDSISRTLESCHNIHVKERSFADAPLAKAGLDGSLLDMDIMTAFEGTANRDNDRRRGFACAH
jgi:hypothetical protein